MKYEIKRLKPYGFLAYWFILFIFNLKQNDNAPFQHSPKMTAARKTFP